MRRIVIITTAALILAAGLGTAIAATAQSPPPAPGFQLVRWAPGYKALAIAGDVLYGRPNTGDTNQHQLWRSLDEGASWSLAYSFPAGSRLLQMRVLASGALLASVTYGGETTVWRSTTGSAWTRSTLTGGGAFAMPSGPDFYTTLVADAFQQDATTVYLGAYTTAAGDLHTNYLWRSFDDGATWELAPGFAVGQPIRTAFKHVHGLAEDGGTLYVLAGDTLGAGIWKSTDHAQTFQQLCSSYDCVAVSARFVSPGLMVYGTDHPYGGSFVGLLDVCRSNPADSIVHLGNLPLASYSAGILRSGTVLIGTTHETANGTTYFGLYAAGTYGVVALQYGNPSTSTASYQMVFRGQFAGSDDFALYVDGYGTFVGRLTGDQGSGALGASSCGTPAPAATTTTAPAVTTAPVTTTQPPEATTPPVTTTAPVTTTTASTNLAPNGDVEGPTGSTYFTGGPCGFSTATDESHSATHSLKIVQTTNTLCRWMTETRTIPVTPGVTYDLSVWMKTVGVSQHAELEANWFTAGEGYIDSADSTRLTGTSGWARLGVLARAPAGAAYVRLEASLTGPGTVWADDFQAIPTT